MWEDPTAESSGMYVRLPNLTMQADRQVPDPLPPYRIRFRRSLFSSRKPRSTTRLDSRSRDVEASQRFTRHVSSIVIHMS
jgi:hypothetical protein